MQRIKQMYLDNLRLILGVIIHLFLIWGALALGYNSYKQVIREFDPLTIAVKDSIKAIFPWGILIFTILYLLCSVLSKKKDDIYLPAKRYGIVIALYALIMNMIFFSRGMHVLIALNLSVTYVAILLIARGLMKRYGVAVISTAVWLESITTQIAYNHLQVGVPAIKEYFKERPLSSKFIIIFLVLLIVCALLLISLGESVAKHLAGVAYLFLVLGVGAGIYQSIRGGDRYEKE